MAPYYSQLIKLPESSAGGFTGTLNPSDDLNFDSNDWFDSDGNNDGFDEIDEGVPTDGDSTYIGWGYDVAAGGEDNSTDAKFRLDQPSETPSGNETIRVRARAKTTQQNSVDGPRLRLSFEEVDGFSSADQQSNFESISTAGYTEHSMTLTQSTKDGVDSWDSVAIWAEANMNNNNQFLSSVGTVRITQMDLSFTE